MRARLFAGVDAGATATAIAIAVLWVAVTAAPAAAAQDVDDGWWTSSPVVVAPDAEDALMVQGGPQAEQPVAYAAVAFTLAEGEEPSRLTLAVAESSASTPSAELMVCPLVEGFTAARGGPMADAPRFDCTSSTTAVAEEDVYSFDVAGLRDGGTLAVAILPIAPTDRVALAPPDVSALESSGASEDGGAGAGAGTAAPPPEPFLPGSDASGTGSSSGAGGGGSAPDLSTPDVELPASADDAPAAGEADEQAGAGAPLAVPTEGSSVSSGQAPATPAGEDGVGAAPIVLIVLVVAAGGLWAFAGLGAGRAAAEEPDA